MLGLGTATDHSSAVAVLCKVQLQTPARVGGSRVPPASELHLHPARHVVTSTELRGFMPQGNTRPTQCSTCMPVSLMMAGFARGVLASEECWAIQPLMKVRSLPLLARHRSG